MAKAMTLYFPSYGIIQNIQDIQGFQSFQGFSFVQKNGTSFKIYLVCLTIVQTLLLFLLE